MVATIPASTVRSFGSIPKKNFSTLHGTCFTRVRTNIHITKGLHAFATENSGIENEVTGIIREVQEHSTRNLLTITSSEVQCREAIVLHLTPTYS